MQERRFKVVVFGKIHPAGINTLNADGRFEIIERPDHSDDRLSEAASSDAIVVRMTKIDQDLINISRGLKIVARHGVGYDTVDVPALTERGVPLALTGDVNSGAVAEHALCLMLNLVKRCSIYDKAIRAGEFSIRDSFSATELSGKSILIIGFGRIGRKVAELCSAFGMKITVVDPFVTSDEVRSLGFSHASDFRDVLKGADIITIHTPKSAETHHLLSAGEFESMKHGVLIINVARGGLVDEAALLAALESGKVRGAGLDVFEPEPPESDNPLLLRDDVILTPHSAAFTVECSENMSLACANNVIGYFDGALDRENVVNPEVLRT